MWNIYLWKISDCKRLADWAVAFNFSFIFELPHFGCCWIYEIVTVSWHIFFALWPKTTTFGNEHGSVAKMKKKLVLIVFLFRVARSWSKKKHTVCVKFKWWFPTFPEQLKKVWFWIPLHFLVGLRRLSFQTTNGMWFDCFYSWNIQRKKVLFFFPKKSDTMRRKLMFSHT